MAQIEIQKILEILPHRYPFLMIDRVLELEEGKRIRALKNVTVNEPCFMGHFPGEPLMPAVLMLEALAQMGGILIRLSSNIEGEPEIFFSSVDRARFRRPVRPGDQLILEGELTGRRGAFWKLKGRALVDGKVAAEAELMGVLRERDPGER